MEEVSYEEEEDHGDPGQVEEGGQEVARLQEHNKVLEAQLRSSEETSRLLQQEVEELRRQLPSKHPTMEEEICLRNRIAYLEDACSRTRVKYKQMKRNFKALQKETCSTSSFFYTTSSFDYDNESINEPSDIEETKDHQEEVVGRLQLELAASEERLRQVTEDKKTVASISEKLEASEAMVQLLRTNLSEVETQLEGFKRDTSSALDEAVQYIKLIENEFNLASSVPGGDSWSLEDKLSQLPSFIKKIYRDFINLDFPPRRSDVSGENDIADSPRLTMAPPQGNMGYTTFAINWLSKGSLRNI